MLGPRLDFGIAHDRCLEGGLDAREGTRGMWERVSSISAHSKGVRLAGLGDIVINLQRHPLAVSGLMPIELERDMKGA